MTASSQRFRSGTRQRAIKVSYPDNTECSDRFADARGEIPVWLLNTTEIKDRVDNNLGRADRGPGYVHLPEWLGIEFYRELVAEVRTESGWELAKSGARNECFELLAYAMAAQLILQTTELNGGPLDWDNPPACAAEWDSNSQITVGDVRRRLAAEPPPAVPRPAADVYAHWESGSARL